MEVVTGVTSSVVEKIVEYRSRLMDSHLGYLIYYETYKKSLTDRVQELNNKISTVQRRALEAQTKGEELDECVTGWISEAERKIHEAIDVVNDRGHENAKCSCNGSFPSLTSRYKLGKKAKLMAKDIVYHIRKPDKFQNFSYRPLEGFESRMQTTKEIMEALEDPDLSMIGVYGMGGIGKTTLVQEVARRAREEGCFSVLVMVTVSENFDLKSIQNRIAEGLDLKLDGEDMSGRAHRLQHRLSQGNKILIILDDIWNELDLWEAGIRFNADEHEGCKILLVSRDKEVLYSRMGVMKNIEVKVLSNSESMRLFYRYVGDKADNPDFKTLANQVVGECGGLPIAIATIARSLANKSLLVWKDTLRQLKRSPKGGMYGKVYSSIKMSYDFLESEEEKKLLLLCSLHGEDANVAVNDLMFYGIGWDLFQEAGTMEEARCRVLSLVYRLKAHSLLSDGDVEDTVKMHNVIRDVMISVAKEDEHMHCLTKVAELEECLHKENFREYSKAIMLLGLDFEDQLLPRLVCPKLQLLLAFSKNDYPSLPDDFLEGAPELKVLSFDRKPLQSLPQSFCTLRHLRALRLQLDKKKDLTLIGELRNLIVLDLSRSTFRQLPEQIGKLTRLRSLNLSYCDSLTVIQPNVISSLVRLEEFYMDQVIIDWEVEGRGGEGRNASLVEFKNLRNLTTLHLNLRDANVLPNDMFSKNLQSFRIMVGSFNAPSSKVSCMQNLRELYVSRCPNLKSLFTLAMAGILSQAERLEIRGCPIMEEVVITNEHEEGRLEKILLPKLKYLELEDLPNLKTFCTGDCIEFPSLLQLRIENCAVLRMFVSSNDEEVEGPFFNEKVSFPVLEYLRLRRMNLKILWADQLSITSFGMQNLKRLYIQNCDSLSHMFSLDVARSLLQLEDLRLWSCKDMEEVLVTKEPIEEGTPQKISFPKLKNLQLWNLQNIRSFCAGSCIKFPSLTNMEIQRNPAIRTFITDSCNRASGELMGSEAKSPLFNGKVAFPKLEALSVRDLNNVNSLFSFGVAVSLVHFKALKVSCCSLIEEIVVDERGDEGTSDKIPFPKVERMHFEGLSNLKTFYGGASIEFPSLLELCLF